MRENNRFFVDVNVDFAYSATLELVSSLHVISDPSHHPNCVTWYEQVCDILDQPLLQRIQDFGKAYVGWSYVMDLVDYLIETPDLQSKPIDDFNTIMSGLSAMPQGRFAYIFLGETLLGDHILSERILKSNDMFSNYDVSELRKYIKWKDAQFFIHNIEAVRSEMLEIMYLYHEAFFKEHWKKTCQFYKSILINEYKTFCGTTVSNYVLSLHDDLYLENETLIFKKETLFRFQNEKISNLKIVFSTYTYPHLMMNHYGSSLTIYENLLIPNMSTAFEGVARSARIFGDSTRLAIIKLLLNSPATTKTLAKLLNMTPASVSQHLKILRDSGILSSHREKNSVIYQVNETRVIEVIETIIKFLELEADF